MRFQEQPSEYKKNGDSGNGSPRRWGWGIPLKKTIRHPNHAHFQHKAFRLSTTILATILVRKSDTG
jgi:hypothetical protein